MRVFRVLLVLGVLCVIPVIWLCAMIAQAFATGDCGLPPVCSRWEAVRYLLLFSGVAFVLTAMVLRGWRRLDRKLAREAHSGP